MTVRYLVYVVARLLYSRGRAILTLVFLASRGMTLGVRGACFDREGRLFLVRHSYTAGWHLPGGGVEWGETILTSLQKELSEEGNLKIIESPRLYGIYYNKNVSRVDYIVLFVCSVEQLSLKQPDGEILESAFFDLNALPVGVTTETKRRIKEILHQANISEYW